jgi:5-methylcytosine-specific restriction endonuclease McrA
MRIHFRDTSNADLLAETKSLVRSSDDLEVKILYRLDEIRCRGLDSAMGYGSTTRFAVEVLGMTPDQAAKRLAALTNCRQWPELMVLLEKGAISLSTVNMVGPRLTEANKDLLLGELAGRSTRETRLLLASVDGEGRRREGAQMVDLRLSLSEEVLARWEHARSLVAKAKMKPLEEALTEIVDDFLARHDPVAKAQRARQRSHEKRATGDCRAAGRSDAAASASADCRAAGRSDAVAGASADCRAAGRSDAVAGASADCRAAGRSDAVAGASADCRAAGCSDAAASASAGRSDVAASVEEDCRAAGCSDVVTGPVADGRTEGRCGAVSTFAGHGTHGSRSRYVPAPVRHALWRRAGGRCEASGCGKTERLQIDHKQVLFCRGGEHDLDNLQLLCTACHKLKTTHELGREALERKVRERVEARRGLYYARGHYLPPIDG